MLPFKKGPFYLAMQTGAPCIPVSIYGTETLMAKGSFAIKPGTAHIVFHAPIYPARLCHARRVDRSRARGNRLRLPEWMRERLRSENLRR
jgi:1-acyl-sn-glycerol-3-phosphate acyltransferase